MSEQENKPTFWQSWGSFLAAVAAILAVRWILVEPYVIPSGSMIPTLLIHDHILVNKMAFGIRLPFTKKWLVQFDQPKRGDIVVFRSVEDDGYFMIKRVIGLPGETVEVGSDGQVKINGENLPVEVMTAGSEPTTQAPYYAVTEADLGGSFEMFQMYREKLGSLEHRTMLLKDNMRWSDRPFIVPPDQVFVMGDNRDNSKDSRYWGSLPVENLLGKAMFVWLSCSDTLPVATFLCNPLKLRWGRFFHGIH